MMTDEFDRPREECGVAGVYTRPGTDVDVARTIFFSLYALQHRGQESAGITTSRCCSNSNWSSCSHTEFFFHGFD